MPRFTNRLITQTLARRGLTQEQLDEAVRKTAAQLEGLQYELGHRVALHAIFSYRENGKLLDIGGGCNAYHLICKNLGMDVTVVDLAYPDDLRPRFEQNGIKLIERNAYDLQLEPESYDVISSFECFEHLPHSPKKIADQIARALKKGGSFVISVPNVARFDQRWRVLVGRTPHEKYSYLYHSGDYFGGHHREMTREEMRYLISEMGLQLEEMFTTDITVKSLKKRSWRKDFLKELNYRYLLSCLYLPPSMRKHIWAHATKR